MKGLYFYKLVSPYQEDVTKDCKLTINEIDHNFITLKDVDIKGVSFDEKRHSLDLVRNNGDEINVDMSNVFEGTTKDLRVDYDDVSGIITIEYNGEQHLIDGLVTDKNIVAKALTEVISDGTLTGLGSKKIPLGIASVEKTGTYKPAYELVDKIKGQFMPGTDHLIKGDRYVTLEEVSDYGYLYDYATVRQINKDLKNGWRVPTKQDWDNMLNAIEPCDEYRNHDSSLANNMLGKFAGKYLKTNDKWLQTDACVAINNTCDAKRDDFFEIYDDSPKEKPSEKEVNPIGVDSYGMSLVPAGFFDECEIVGYFKKKGYYWTSTMINETDVYVKRFDYNKTGVVQTVECPRSFFSLRLVKDYDGSNFLQTEYINGMTYNTVLMPAQNTKHGHSIWTASNVAYTNDRYNPIEPNNGEGLSSRRAFFINEWNGFDWERKEMLEGESIVLFKGLNGEKNIEYRIMNGELYSEANTIYDEVMKEVKPEIDRIDEIIGEGVKDENGKVVDLTTVVGSGFTNENGERVSVTDKVQHVDDVLGTGFTDEEGEIITVTDKLENEISDRLAADEQFRDDLDQEIRDREEADNILQQHIDEETDAREESDTLIHLEIDAIEDNVGLTRDGNFIKREGSNFINDAETVMGAVDLLDGSLKEEENRRKAQDDVIEENVGLDENGNYILREDSFYINDALTVVDAVNILDDQLHIERMKRENQDDKIEAGTGLSKEGEYVAKETPNYIGGAFSINSAVEMLDDALREEENGRKAQDDVIEENVGLDKNGIYILREDSNYINDAKSVVEAISLLDNSLKKEAVERDDIAKDLQDELDVTQASVGLDEEGLFIPRPNSHFITTATTVMGAIDDLDYQAHLEEDQRHVDDWTIRCNVGLDEESGMYVARPESNNIKDAETVMGAIDLLDSSLDTERDARVSQDDRIEAGVGLDENGDYIKLTDQDAYYIHNSENLAHAVKKLDSALKVEENDRVAVSDKINESVGLSSESEYVRTDGKYISSANSIAESINMLDSSLNNEEAIRVSQIDKIENSVGLSENGEYVKRDGSNYIDEAKSVMGAVDMIDKSLKDEETIRTTQDTNIKTAVGLNEDGTYKENVGYFIGDATTVMDAVQKVDAALKNETLDRDHGDAAVQNELNIAESSIGLNEDGTYKPTEGKYTSEAVTIAGAVNSLDKSLGEEAKVREETDTYIKSRLIKEGLQPNDKNTKAFDCANGILTLFAEDPKHNIVINLSGDYGELPYTENDKQENL